MQKSNYYQGLVDGLNVGINVLKWVLEEGEVSQDDVLEEYNAMVREAYHAYAKLQEVQEQTDLFGDSINQLYIQLGGKQ